MLASIVRAHKRTRTSHTHAVLPPWVQVYMWCWVCALWVYVLWWTCLHS